MLDGICYFVAHFRGEKFEESDKSAAGLGVDSNKVKTAAATKAIGII